MNRRGHLGRAGEAAAARYLEARGYRIVGRNVRADRVEIDLIARRGPTLVFVEVKTRRSDRYGSAAEAVDARKQARIRRGAGAWLATKPDAARGMRSLRFDVVTCTPRDDAPTKTTAPERTRWSMEHWKAAF